MPAQVSSIFRPPGAIGPAFSWASITLAVFTALLQGMVTALASMTESSARWTFRFRLALFEHIWWTFVSFLLLASLGMSTVAFTSGEGGDPVSVLALSSATFLAVVQFSIPAWQQRTFTRTRWYAWTGESRTAIKREFAIFCDAASWCRLTRRYKQRLVRLQPTPSDYYGWRLWSAPGLRVDPTDMLRVLGREDIEAEDTEKASIAIGVYASAAIDASTVSLRWGERQGFGRRVSRAISSMPHSLLRSSPVTADGYDGKGLTNAMGILGRNKGLQPWNLVFRSSPDVTSPMENSSTWTPRPAKVLRSFYRHTLLTQYGGLGEDFVGASVELALLLVDIPNWVIDYWLMLGLEHQCLETNIFLAENALMGCTLQEREEAITAHYESSYVSMILSLNAMKTFSKDQRRILTRNHISRPDLICTGLLLKARGKPEPRWWNWPAVVLMRASQIAALSESVEWRLPAARLLGLRTWPARFDDIPSIWNAVE